MIKNHVIFIIVNEFSSLRGSATKFFFEAKMNVKGFSRGINFFQFRRDVSVYENLSTFISGCFTHTLPVKRETHHQGKEIIQYETEEIFIFCIKRIC